MEEYFAIYMAYPADTRFSLFKISFNFICQVHSDSAVKRCVTIFVLKHGVNLRAVVAVPVYDYTGSVSHLTDTLL